MIQPSRKKIIVGLLACLFIAPGLAAYFLYTHKNWLNVSLNNKGTLLKPPILITELSSKTPWHLVLWAPQLSEKEAMEQLARLNRIRIALGRRYYDVELVALNSSDPAVKKSAQPAIRYLKLTNDSYNTMQTKYSKPMIFIADPHQFLILSYPIEVKSDDVFQDLKLLLNTTRVSNSPDSTSLIAVHRSESLR